MVSGTEECIWSNKHACSYVLFFACRRGEALHEIDEAVGEKYRENYFNFYDSRLMDGAWKQKDDPKRIEMFFRLLAVCHTVIPSGEQVCVCVRVFVCCRI